MGNSDGGVGTVAQQMANAPRAEGKKVNIPFELVGFKMPAKKEAFPADENGNVSERIALAILRVRGSQIHFQASIYKVTSLKDVTAKPVYRASMPSTGKQYPRPVFVTDDTATQRAYDEWREELVVKHFYGWAKEQQAAGVTAPIARSNGFSLDL